MYGNKTIRKEIENIGSISTEQKKWLQECDKEKF